MDTNFVTLLTFDNQELQVKKSIAEKMITVRSAIQDSDNSTTVPLVEPACTANVIQLIIDYYTFMESKLKPEKFASLSGQFRSREGSEINKWEKEHMPSGRENRDFMINLIKASNFLHCDTMTELASKYFCKGLKMLDLEGIKNYFNDVAPPTEDDLEQTRIMFNLDDIKFTDEDDESDDEESSEDESDTEDESDEYDNE